MRCALSSIRPPKQQTLYLKHALKYSPPCCILFGASHTRQRDMRSRLLKHALPRAFIQPTGPPGNLVYLQKSAHQLFVSHNDDLLLQQQLQKTPKHSIHPCREGQRQLLGHKSKQPVGRIHSQECIRKMGNYSRKQKAELYLQAVDFQKWEIIQGTKSRT